MKFIFDGVKNFGILDYVTAWYKKTFDFISDERLLGTQKINSPTFRNTKIQCAFVSTNSLTQGEQVLILREITPFIINFAHRTFKWQSESKEKAAVHCVIIGFANFHREKKFIFDGDKKIPAKNIDPYLIDAPNILIHFRSKPLCDVPKMTNGNQATDDGNFIFSEEEAENFSKKYPAHKKFLHRYLGAKDFLHNKPIRFCLWLKNVPPNEFSNNREIMRRIENIKKFREKSSSPSTRKSAETPQKFFSTPQTNENYIAIPRTSSERRKYLPIKFLSPEIISNCDLCIIPNAELFHFGILSSSVHMAWTKTVCGRLKSDFRYSGSVVYNNFVWCDCSEIQCKKIEQTAQKILDCRKNYPEASLADLYDPTLMPKDLRDAHRKNDLAVMSAYGFLPIKNSELKIKNEISEEEILKKLIELYKNLTEKI